MTQVDAVDRQLVLALQEGLPLDPEPWAQVARMSGLDEAAVVARLRAAGATVVGTTKLHEFAFGVTGINEWDGTAANPD